MTEYIEYWKCDNKLNCCIYRVINPDNINWEGNFVSGNTQYWLKTFGRNSTTYPYKTFKEYRGIHGTDWTFTKLSPEEIESLKVSLL